MKTDISTILAAAGTIFMVVAAIGIARMPDLFLRMSAVAKAGTLGVSLLMLGAIIHFDELGVTMRLLAIVIFLFITAPVAAHMIGRAAYYGGVELWEGTRFDEWFSQRKTHPAGTGEFEQPPSQRRQEAADTSPSPDEG